MNFQITILGSGAALPIGARHCSAQMLNIDGFKILLDCAEGTQGRIRHNHIRLQSIGTIVISHLHGDHFFGLPGLLSTMHLCGRTEAVTIIAPTGAKQAIETLFSVSGNHINYPIEWHEVETFERGEKCVFENDRCVIFAFPLSHTVPTFGYKILAHGRNETQSVTYSYCCDTIYDEAIIPHVAGSDLLCLECTFSNEYAPLAEKCYHLTAGGAGRLAKLAGVKNLLLTHISARFRDPSILLQQAQQEFEKTIIAADNMRLNMNPKMFCIASQLAEKEKIEA